MIDITVMVIDNGLFVESACRLGRDVKKVYYYCPWEDGFPKMNKAYIGYGLEGIEVISTPFGPELDKSDLIYFPDVYYGPLQLRLEQMGKIVFGSRMGENLELSRDGMKKLMQHLNMPVGPWRIVKGTAALREHLKRTPDQWVKMNIYRGTFESFFSPNYKNVEPKLDEIEYNLGAFKYIAEFIVEDNLPDKIEVACDFYSADGKFPSRFLLGIEIKDKAYLGVFKHETEFPPWVTEFNRKIAPTLAQYKYRCNLSPEIRVGKDKKPYMIDFCARQASPPGELYQEFYQNFADIVWQTANGRIVEPVPAARYGAQVMIHSSWADKNWQPIEFPAEYRQYIKLRNACKINDRYYVIPQTCGLPEVGSVIGWGNTWQDAVEMVKEIAGSVEGYYVEKKNEAFDEAEEQMEEAEKMGLGFMR